MENNTDYVDDCGQMDAITYVRVYCWCAAIEHTTSSHFALCVKQLATALNVYSTKKHTQSTYPRLPSGEVRAYICIENQRSSCMPHTHACTHWKPHAKPNHSRTQTPTTIHRAVHAHIDYYSVYYLRCDLRFRKAHRHINICH